MISLLIIIKNNIENIEKCFQSTLFLNPKILIANIDCTDSAIHICRKYGAKIIDVPLNNDFSHVRNKLISLSETRWQLFLEPWESLIAGQETLLKAIKTENKAYKLQIIQDDLINKEIRLWDKNLNLKFVNPVYETIDYSGQCLETYISSKPPKTDNTKLIEAWRKKTPLSTDLQYYEGCHYLTQKQWDKFIKTAEHYLFQKKGGLISSTMTKYYCSLINCYVYKRYKPAIDYILDCIVTSPTMAEFWCLLGDIYYATKNYEKAQHFYENAIILGQKRLKLDDWPMEISKYKEYPNKMINACKNIISKSILLKQNI